MSDLSKGFSYIHSVHVLAAGCIISKVMHPADALFFQMFSIHSC